jgi:uncharacterized protein YbjQ (UPF0145 family)
MTAPQSGDAARRAPARVPSALPEAARGRLASVAAGHARSSLESVAGGAGLGLVGFDPVTEVMGCVVVHLGWSWYSCGYWGMSGGYGNVYSAPTTLVTGVHGGGFAPYGKAVQGAWNTALQRLLAEAAAVGADGVVGITPTRRRVPGSVSDDEFVLLGTAVRARGGVRPRRPFATDLGGDRFAALLRAGWVPTGFSMTVAVGVRHDDWATQQAASVWNGNQEVPGYTQLVHDTRRATRDQFGRSLARLGSENAIVSDMRMRIWEVEPSENHRDHICEVTISGTGLVSYRRSTRAAAPRVLTVMPMTDRTRLQGRQR